MSFKEFSEKKLLDEGARYNFDDGSFLNFERGVKVDIDKAIELVDEFHQVLNDWKEYGWDLVVAHHPKEIIPMKK